MNRSCAVKGISGNMISVHKTDMIRSSFDVNGVDKARTSGIRSVCIQISMPLVCDDIYGSPHPVKTLTP